MITTIRLQDAEFRAYHGCYQLEKQVGNHFVVDITVTAEVGDAPQRDDVASSINYLKVYAIAEEQMRQTSNIIENVALRILDAIYAGFQGVQHVEVTVSKIAPPLGGKVARVSATVAR